MKVKIIVAALALILASPVNAQNAPVMIQQRTETIEIDLTEETVKCLIGDYGATSLKVLIPELANLTILNHRVPGSNAPCVTAGFCGSDVFTDGFEVDDIIDPDKQTEKIDVEVRLFRSSHWDETKQVCSITLMEDVKTKIKGIDFFHSRQVPVEEHHGWDSGPRPKEDCI